MGYLLHNNTTNLPDDGDLSKITGRTGLDQRQLSRQAHPAQQPNNELNLLCFNGKVVLTRVGN